MIEPENSMDSPDPLDEAARKPAGEASEMLPEDISRWGSLPAEVLSLRERVELLEARVQALTIGNASASASVPPQIQIAIARENKKAEDRPKPSASAAADVSFQQPVKPSLEARIGSQWFNRIGILAVLIGAAWFLKYAVDQHWLGSAARLWIGIASGISLIAWSERFRHKDFPVFAFSLKAVGTGLLYLSLWAAFSLFHLVSYPVAFCGMVLVTIGNAWLCWWQRSELLAAYAMVGGLLTPALLNSQDVPIPALGSYLLLLNAGLLALLLVRRWPRLLPGAFVGTSSYLIGLSLHAGPERTEIGFLTVLFFIGFSLAPFAVAAMGESGARIAVALTVSNALLGGFELWHAWPGGEAHAQWLPVLLAVWFAVLLVPAARFAAGLRPVFGGLVVAFAALGLWTLLPVPGVIAGWALEGASLLFLAQRRDDSGLFQSPRAGDGLILASAILLAASSIGGSLAVKATQAVVVNERFGLYLLLVCIAAFTVRLAARQHGARLKAGLGGSPTDAQWVHTGSGAAITGTILLLLGGVFEIHRYWLGILGTGERFWDSAWAAVLGVGLLILGFKVRWALLRWQALVLLTLAIVKVFLFDTRSLSQGFRILSFLGLGVLLLAVSFIYQRDLLHLRGEEHQG